jgi:hypothetical protein
VLHVLLNRGYVKNVYILDKIHTVCNSSADFEFFTRYTVVTTVRSKAKGEQILTAHPTVPKEKLAYVVVSDIAQDGAFDAVSCFCD